MTPRQDIPSAGGRRAIEHERAVQRQAYDRLGRRFPDLRGGGRPGAAPSPADPPRPDGLSGGAAAPFAP